MWDRAISGDGAIQPLLATIFDGIDHSKRRAVVKKGFLLRRPLYIVYSI